MLSHIVAPMGAGIAYDSLLEPHQDFFREGNTFLNLEKNNWPNQAPRICFLLHPVSSQRGPSDALFACHRASILGDVGVRFCNKRLKYF